VAVLKSVNTVVGYKTYVDLIYPLIAGKQIISSGMTQEVQRVEAAIGAACHGASCALISSGDPGIYAMAGLVFETCQAQGIAIAAPGFDAPEDTLTVEVIPGVPALCAAASLLGAPLTHDFATISLSDLLTPWELIEKRLESAASADFVIVLYNPRSKKRSWQLKKAQQILLKYRDKNTPAGIVVSAMRPNQDVRIVPLEKLHQAAVDMQTTVFIGSSASSRYLDFMITPRGYSKKYKINSDRETA
jgi:precorrin-3B C17-methyltransferase